jgi:hypothetical protein
MLILKVLISHDDVEIAVIPTILPFADKSHDDALHHVGDVRDIACVESCGNNLVNVIGVGVGHAPLYHIRL